MPSGAAFRVGWVIARGKIYVRRNKFFVTGAMAIILVVSTMAVILKQNHIDPVSDSSSVSIGGNRPVTTASLGPISHNEVPSPPPTLVVETPSPASAEFLAWQRSILVNFFHATGGDIDWDDDGKEGWMDSLDVCEWAGILCSDDNVVKNINLSGTKLTGRRVVSVYSYFCFSSFHRFS